MSAILATITLIILFASLTLVVKKTRASSLCPICLGVSLTWITLTALMLAGFLPTTFYLLPTAILIGGTMVGIVYQGEKKFQAMRSLPPKLFVLVAGLFLADLFLANMSWLTLASAILILIPLGYLFFLRPPQTTARGGNSEDLQGLEDKMKDCC